MELIKNTVNICRIPAKGTTKTMVDSDVIVPDVKPDILKILQVDADCCVTDTYIENGKLIINGRVDYKVLYIPDTENERIKSILTSMDFRQSADAGGGGMDCVGICVPSIERVEFNTVNSRKLRLRAIVDLDYEVCIREETQICSDIEGEETERKQCDMSFENTVEISSHDFTVKELVEIPSGQRSIKEILKTDVSVTDTEYKSLNGKVIVKGVVDICVLYTDTECEIKFVSCESPFTEVFDAEGAGEDTVFDIDWLVINVMSELQSDSDGDLRLVAVDTDIQAYIRGSEKVLYPVLCDCFVPDMKTKCHTEPLSLVQTVERPSLQNTIREIIDFTDDIPGVSAVYNVMNEAVITKAEQEGKRIICEGKIETRILYLTDTSENPLYMLKKDIPFSYMLECESDIKGLEIDAKVQVRHLSYNLTSSGSLELRCLVGIDTRLIKNTVIENITSVENTECDRRKGIVVYFAKQGDVLWDIAKKYSTSCEKIAMHNNLENEKISKGAKIFIPSC